MRVYLLINAGLYLLFAVWCAASPAKTAASVGLSLASPSGVSEYVTVYGGLQFGVAMFFLVAGVMSKYEQAGVLFAMLFYGGLVAFRLGTFLVLSGIGRTTFLFAGLELVLGAAALALWLMRKA